ncbi:MAG TPA: outer membrane protein [Xanthobacteraceae bacterium]|nr:outer membrane protein [Xanthobacteraceae bacterium]
MLLVAAAAAVTAALYIAPASAAPFDWTGFYSGVNQGGALSKSHNADPFIDPIDGATAKYGDRVRSTGAFFGGEIGYNYQINSTVYGIEADLNWADISGTFTCLDPGSHFSGATCQVRPNWFGSVAGRLGWAVGPAGRTLIYGRGGLAWLHDKIDITLNQPFGVNFTNDLTKLSPFSQWGWTLGGGVEYALSRDWSIKLEYDYLSFGSHDVTTPRATVGMFGPDGRKVGLSQDIHTLRLGLNYRLGGGTQDGLAFDAPMRNVASSYELEIGTRYLYGWGRFQKNFGLDPPFGFPPNTLVSRLTYDNMLTNSGELFARFDAPNNFMLKGFAGAGEGKTGHMNDEDMGVGGVFMRYSNTIADPVTDRLRYLTIDAGYDWLKGSGYRVASFVGFNRFNSHMEAFGCAPIVAVNCIPPAPNTGHANITEFDRWDAVRLGTAAEVMILPQLKLTAEAAYLPYVSFKGVDHHYFGNTSDVYKVFPSGGHGRGVQLESVVSYEVTERFSIGIGGRYWAMWTTKGSWDCEFTGVPGGCGPPPPPPPKFYRAEVEQAAAFVQASYKFGSGGN